MNDPHLDFRRLKAMVSIEHVLAASGLDAGLRRMGNRLVGPCPIHGGDNQGAFVVSLENNTWYCFTRCASGGDVVELVRRLRRCGYLDAARYLASLVGGHGSARPPTPTTSPQDKATFRPFTRRLPLDPVHRLLQAKGIHPETARAFEVGAYRGRGFLQGCVAVRLHDTDGRPLGYAGRRLDRCQARLRGKWKLPPRLPKSRLLYNLHRVARSGAEDLVVVEGPWDVLRLAQLRVPAVALLGTALSDHQRTLLDGVSRVILLLDGDEAGRTASSRLQRRLAPLTVVHVVPLPDGLDPDDLSDARLAACMRPFFSL